MSIRFKFRSSVNFDTVEIGNRDSISVAELRLRILRGKDSQQQQGFDLVFSDAVSGLEYKCDSQIPSGSSVIVKRVPGGTLPSPVVPIDAAKRVDLKESHNFHLAKAGLENDFDDLGADLCPKPDSDLPGSYQEFDKNKFMVNKKDDVAPIPNGFGQHGNDRNNLPLDDEQMKSNKLHASNFPTVQSTNLPLELKCSLCNNFFTDAVMIPCCQHSFCEKCIRQVLVAKGMCPKCSSRKCIVGDLLPNLSLRRAIEHLLESQMFDAGFEDVMQKYAPDGESGIQANDVSCALTVAGRVLETPQSSSATGKGSNQVLMPYGNPGSRASDPSRKANQLLAARGTYPHDNDMQRDSEDFAQSTDFQGENQPVLPEVKSHGEANSNAIRNGGFWFDSGVSGRSFSGPGSYRTCGMRHEEVGERCVAVDWISPLPDDIIVHMLSFLPLKEVVATSLVSRRWCPLWRYTPNLIFKNDRDDPMINIPVTMPELEHDDACQNLDQLMRSLKNIEWVNSVLASHKSLSLKQFAISFYMHKDCHCQVLPEWIHFALSRQVESLMLDLCFSPYVLELDNNIFSSLCTSTGLRELTLKSLKVSGKAIEMFLRNCSLLERLIMHGVSLTTDLVVSGSLKYLDIVSRRRNGISIKVFAPNLAGLRCFVFLNLFSLENVPNLVEASFEHFGPGNVFDQLATAAAKLEVLTITLDKPKVSGISEMPRLKKLVLNCKFLEKKLLLPITRIIEASPCLEEFRLKISIIGMHESKFPRIFEVGSIHPHYHLKVFEFSGFCWGAVDHVELLRYMVDSCIVLQEIVITPICPLVVVPPEHSDFLGKSDCKDNPYLTWAGSSDPRVVYSKAELRIKKRTQRVLAEATSSSKLPHHHLKLRIL